LQYIVLVAEILQVVTLKNNHQTVPGAEPRICSPDSLQHIPPFVWCQANRWNSPEQQPDCKGGRMATGGERDRGSVSRPGS